MKIHLVRWDKVTTPTSLGGLGIFQMRARNATILAKLRWRSALSSKAPWALMLTFKYLTPARLGEKGKKITCLKYLGSLQRWGCYLQ